MTKVIADITMSLDGFVTAPNAGPDAGLGDDGMPLHAWVFGGHDVDEAVLAATTERSGAVVMGRNLFDVVDSPGGWDDDIGYGAHNVGRPPFFAVRTDEPREMLLVVGVDDVVGAECRRGVHAHVQRRVVLVAEAALGPVDVHRGQAEVQDDGVARAPA